MRIVIVIPTYNEAENIGRMIDVLEDVFSRDPGHDYNILVVEGNSPDGTADIVREKMETKPFVHLLMEQKKAGLGAAYAYGFKYAEKELHADVLVEMDADFQHDPYDVPRLVAEIDNGYDYVIGSRFIKGGSIPERWGLYRKFLSVGGSLFTKVVLWIFNVNDFTSGFKASRVKGFADKLDLDNILSGGFAYKIDLLYKMYKLGAKIKEIPIKFGLRDRGDSKMERNNFRDSLRVVLTLRYNQNKEFFKFAVVGVAGVVTDAGFFNILRVVLNDPRTAALISGPMAVITTYTLNNYWSFKGRDVQGTGRKILGFVIYFASSYVPIFVRSQLVGFAVSRFGNTFIVSNTAFFIGVVIGLIWNFTVYSKIIWRKKNA
jgi:dolichol-phosphate mannosyltransferase